MEKIDQLALVKYLKDHNLKVYSKDIYLEDCRYKKIETELKLVYLSELDLLQVFAEYKEKFYDELEDEIDKLIYYNLGDIYLDNNIIKFEKLIESKYIQIEIKNKQELLNLPDLENFCIPNQKAFAKPEVNSNLKFEGYLLGLRRLMVDRTVDIQIVYFKQLPTVEDIRNLIIFTKIPIIDQSRFQDDKYLELVLERLKETIDLDMNDLAKGCDLSCYDDTSITQSEKLGIFKISIPGMNLYLNKNYILPQ